LLDYRHFFDDVLSDGPRSLLAIGGRLVRERLKAAEKDVVRIASENARLVTENTVLKARLASRNVIEFAGTKPGSKRRLRSVA
jgi:regulator of replication initiation timing